MNAELKQGIKNIALDYGCSLIGSTNVEALSVGPPSAGPAYLLRSAKSVISFALPLDAAVAEDFISKRDWLSHCNDRKDLVQRLYRLGDEIAAYLRGRGFKALNVDLNNNYRPEEGAADVTEQTEFHPEFSHRYAAVAAGVGRLGWSGNLMTKEYGALVELGSVITNAELPPDSPIPDEEHPCDRCKMCTAVCPVGMVNPHEETTVSIAGITEKISEKSPNTCCWIGCTGYEGIAASGSWGNFSPYTLGKALPRDKETLDALCISLQKADPQMQKSNNSFADYRGAVFTRDWLYYTVCGFCRTVCAPARNDRIARRKVIASSGRTALAMSGLHVPAEENTKTIQTPFGLQVVVNSDDYRSNPAEPENAFSELDREILRFLEKEQVRGGL